MGVGGWSMLDALSIFDGPIISLHITILEGIGSRSLSESVFIHLVNFCVSSGLIDYGSFFLPDPIDVLVRDDISGRSNHFFLEYFGFIIIVFIMRSNQPDVS